MQIKKLKICVYDENSFQDIFWTPIDTLHGCNVEYQLVETVGWNM
jgi:hypothetical protein